MTRMGTTVYIAWLCGAFPIQAETMPWAGDFETARKTAAVENRLLMVSFYTDWCGWCKRMDQETFTNEKVIKLAGQFVPVKVNAEKEGVALARKYKPSINGFPTILFLDQSGEIIGRIRGYTPPELFADSLTRVGRFHLLYVKAQDTLKREPENAEANAAVAWVMSMRGNAAEAEAAFTRAEKAKLQGDLMGDTCNALGDLYQTLGQFDKAGEMYRKAAAATRDVSIRSYAFASLLVCCQANEDVEGAENAARELLNIPGIRKEYADMAKATLNP